LQPHRSSATVETRAAMGQLVRENLRAFFEAMPLVTEYPTH
jgi:lactate dehydrogenase-like 2-hydroxyacid dehydrogenase